MKKQYVSSFLILLFSFTIICSCTIQKRTVNKGYFVQWNWDKKIKSQKSAAENINSEEIDLAESSIMEEISAPELVLETAPLEHIQKDSKTDFDLNAQDLAIQEQDVKAEKFKTEHLTTLEKVPAKFLKRIKKVKPPMDGELMINILLLIVFLVLAIIFTLLAIKTAAGLMLYIWAILALVAFIIFVTQVIDVIMW